MIRKKLTKYMPLLVLPMVLAVCLFMWVNLGRGNVVVVHESSTGVWDLRGKDFDGDTVYRLYGTLEMIMREFLNPQEFAENEERAEHRSTHGNAFGTSRLRVLLPESEWFTFARMSLDFAHRLYVDGSYMLQAGVPGRTAEEETAGSQRVMFTARAGGGVVEIVSQASSYAHRNWGYHHAWYVGGSHLQELILAADFMQNIILGCFLGLFLIYMLMWVLQKGDKARGANRSVHHANLYFALFALMWFFRAGVTGSFVLVYTMPWLGWYTQLRLEYLTLPVTVWLLCLIINALFPGILPKLFRLATYAASAAVSLFFIFADTLTASLHLTPVYIYCGVFIVFVIIRFIWKFRRPNMAQAVFFGGILMFLYAALRDLLWREEIILLPPFRTEGIMRMEITEFTFTMIAALMFTFCTAAAVFIANRKETEDINAAMYRAEAESKAKSDFLSKMSHEIRTPMNAVIGMTELVLREDISPAAREYAQTIKHSGSHLLSIINDILDFSKIESGKIEIVNADYELHSTVYDVVSIINTHLTSPKVTFKAHIERDIPGRLTGDEVRLRQILLNILSNAVKYTHEGHISLQVSWKKTGASTMTLILSVKDTGIGIKPENMGSLFGEFSQFDLEKNRNVEGVGLGLAITYNLVKLMGGEIRAESVYGQGSTFTVTLPQKYREDGISSVPPESGAGAARFTAPGAKILAADDVPTNLAVVRGLLKPYGVAVTLCGSGKEAVQAVQRDNYDLVFMDHMMPEMDGLEAVKAIRRLKNGKYEKLPIIALTANAVAGARDTLLQSGFDDFLSKPVEVDKLDSILAKWIPAEKRETAFPNDSREADVSAGLVIPGINVTKGVSISGGSLENYMYLLGVFREDGEIKLRRLVKCLEDNDLSLYTTYIHALKSACANIGAAEAAAMAGELESAGFRHDMAFIAKRSGYFAKTLEALLTDIDTAISAAKINENKEVDRSALRPLLSELKTALENFDAAAIDKASRALQNITVCAAVDETLKDILQSAFTSKCKQAAAQIDELLETI